MKKLMVSIRVELEIPDEWELRKTSEGVDVLQIGEGQFMDLTFHPILTNDLEGLWTDSAHDDLIDSLLDMAVFEEVRYTLTTLH